MQVNVTIKNIEQIRHAMRLAPKDMARELGIAIQKATYHVERQTRINVTGRYIKVQSGRLRSSIQSRFTKTAGYVEIPIDDPPYPFYLHDGTKYIFARPFLSDAVLNEEDRIQAYFNDAVDNVFKKIARRT